MLPLEKFVRFRTRNREGFQLSVTNVIQRLDEVRAVMETLQEKLDAAKAAETRILMEEIPTLMQELKMKKIVLDDGRLVEVKDIVQASLPVKNVENAKRGMEWLRTHEGEGIIKGELSIDIPKNGDNFAKALIAAATEMGLHHVLAEKVNHATLSAWVREQIQDAKPVPTAEDGFEIFIGQKASIKNA